MSRLQELEGLLAFLAPTDIMVVGKQLAARLVPSLCSPHVEVMKGALYLLVSEDVDAVLAETAAAVGAGEGSESERAVVETMFQKEESLKSYLKAAADDASQIEAEILEEWNMIARDIYAIYPL